MWADLAVAMTGFQLVSSARDCMLTKDALHCHFRGVSAVIFVDFVSWL